MLRPTPVAGGVGTASGALLALASQHWLGQAPLYVPLDPVLSTLPDFEGIDLGDDCYVAAGAFAAGLCIGEVGKFLWRIRRILRHLELLLDRVQARAPATSEVARPRSLPM